MAKDENYQAALNALRNFNLDDRQQITANHGFIMTYSPTAYHKC